MVVKERDATFRSSPGTSKHRPPQTTPIPNLFLAGDWTDTGWPSTMEGAVRSGVFAADALLPIHAAVSVLYVLAPTLGAVGRGERAVLGWTAASAGLAILSFLLTHLPDPDASSTLRLMFALLALGLTVELLLFQLEFFEIGFGTGSRQTQ